MDVRKEQRQQKLQIQTPTPPLPGDATPLPTLNSLFASPTPGYGHTKIPHPLPPAAVENKQVSGAPDAYCASPNDNAPMGLSSSLPAASSPALERVIADTTCTTTEHPATVDAIRGPSTTSICSMVGTSGTCSGCSTPQVPAAMTSLSGATSATGDAGLALAETPPTPGFLTIQNSVPVTPVGAAGQSSALAAATSTFGDPRPDHANQVCRAPLPTQDAGSSYEPAIATIGAFFLRRLHTAHMGLPSTLHDTSLPALECVIADTTSTSTEHKAPVDSIRGLTGPMRWEWKPGLFEDMVPIETRWRTRPECVCVPVSALAHGLLDFG